MSLLELAWLRGVTFKIQQKKEEFVVLLKYLEGKKSVLEIGTNTGGTAVAFATVVHSLVVTIDIDPIADQKALLRLTPNVCFETGDSRGIRSRFGKLVDCLYIDGDHSEEACRTDYELYKDLVKPGGMIAFHDIANSKLHKIQNCGVWKVWEDVKKDHPYIEVLLGDIRWGGIGIIFLPDK